MPSNEGPDETTHDEEAVEEADRRMTGGTDHGDDSDDSGELRGPDGTKIDKQAAEEAERKMTGDT